ncbi:MAG: hypothetical protein CSA15_05750, partial [Candidatus Delongbacteria bacterium]
MIKNNLKKYYKKSKKTREIIANFNGGDITSDGGSPLLSIADSKTGLCDKISKYFHEYRKDLSKVEHSILNMLRQ